MIKLGLTGPMGSGKTFVSKIFEDLGIKVYNSDLRARSIINDNIELRMSLIERFGNIYDESGLNRELTKKLLFGVGTRDNLFEFNQIVKPFIVKDFDKFCQENSNEIILAESAILFETSMESLMDKVITVTAPYEVRLKRSIKRDAITKEDYDFRIQNNMPIDTKILLSDFIIINDGINDLEDQVKEILNQVK